MDKLMVALKAGELGGVALDVYEEEEGIFFEDHSSEPLQDDELSLVVPLVLLSQQEARQQLTQWASRQS